jgi:uncharacterized protein (DUF2267 family)
MDELVQLVSEKTGISEEKSRQAVSIVVAYLKERLPAPVAKQVDKALNQEGGMEDLAENLGGMFGKK